MAARVAEYHENDTSDQDLIIKLCRNPNELINSSGVIPNEFFDFQALFGTERLAEFEAVRYQEFSPELRQQLNRSQSHISMGLFSRIGRAWMSVDSDLFFWKFDTNSDFAFFDSITDTITHVQLVKPKLQYVDAKVHFLMVVVTSTEVILFGVGFNNPDGIPLMRDSGIYYDACEMLIFDEYLFKTTNDCRINAIESTEEGRIFVIGHDSLYEINYYTGNWFRGPKCDKINLSKTMLARVIPAISYLTSAEELRQIAVDDSRHILYTLGDRGTVTVYDMGDDGSSFASSCSMSLLDIQKTIRNNCGIEDDFLAGIVQLIAIPSTRSRFACLEAVTTKGMRIFFTVFENYQQQTRPSSLRIIHIRYPPPELYGLNCGANIYCAYQDSETFFLGHMIDDVDSSLTAISSSCFQYNANYAESYIPFRFSGSIWEIALLHEQTNSKNIAVAPISPPWVMRQHVERFRKLYVLSSEGIYVFHQSSPLELFRRLINLYECDSRQFVSFANVHGPQEICVMALNILATNLADNQEIENAAIRVLMEFGGSPAITVSQDIVDRSTYSYANNQSQLPSSTPFNGQIINDENVGPRENITPSFRHDAFYTYFSRIVYNIWESPLCNRQNNFAFNALPMDQVEEVIQYTGALLAAIKKYNLLTYNSGAKLYEKDQARAYEAELKSLQEFERLVTSTHEFLNLWKILDEHQFHVLTRLLPDDVFAGVGNIRLCQAIASCRETATEFVNAIVKHYISDEATTAVISQRLSEECPSLFTSHNAFLLKASENIANAKSLPLGPDRHRAIQGAVEFLRKCVQYINMGLICDLLKEVNAYDAIAELALQRAFNEDPSKIAAIAYRESLSQIDGKVRDALAKRNDCYKYIDEALDYLQREITTGGNGDISAPFAISQRDSIISKVLASDDELAHINLFQWMLKNGMEDRLLKKQHVFFEQFLLHEIKQGGGERYLQLLWKYYEKNENYVSAAKLLLDFAGNSPKMGLKRRMTYLSHALLCIQSAAENRQNQELKQKVQEFLDVTQIQQQTFDEIEKMSNVKISQQEAQAALELLDSKLFTLTYLYSTFADQYNLPIIKLGIVKCANHFDADTVEEIWKEILMQCLNCNDATTIRARLTETLSKLYRLYGSSHYFPVDYITKYISKNQAIRCDLDGKGIYVCSARDSLLDNGERQYLCEFK